jgi:hypothetical protein
MSSQFDVEALSPAPSPLPPACELTSVLQQILEVQRAQLNQLRATAAAQDAGARWRSMLARWRQDFPGLPAACRQALPILERAYGSIIAALVADLRQNGEDALDNDFTLQEFLDRYGLRLGQLGNLLNLVGPLAEASSQSESA